MPTAHETCRGLTNQMGHKSKESVQTPNPKDKTSWRRNLSQVIQTSLLRADMQTINQSMHKSVQAILAHSAWPPMFANPLYSLMNISEEADGYIEKL